MVGTGQSGAQTQGWTRIERALLEILNGDVRFHLRLQHISLVVENLRENRVHGDANVVKKYCTLLLFIGISR